MRAILLAAGRGSRLSPLTDDRPKCMVELMGRPLIDWQIETLQRCGVEEIGVVGGYLSDVLARHLAPKGIEVIVNPDYSTTNMVHSLFCAKEWLDGDTLLAYTDIVYDDGIVKALIDDPAPISISVDTKWQQLWSLRMEDIFSDAETLRLNDTDHVIELGGKPKSMKEIEAQYMGLIKIQGGVWPRLIDFHTSKRFDPNVYMTDFIQAIIDEVTPVHAVRVEGGWLEVDTIEDLKAYEHQATRQANPVDREDSQSAEDRMAPPKLPPFLQSTSRAY